MGSEMCIRDSMKALGVDVYLTAPQKGWSSPACAGIVMLGPRANKAVSETTSDTYSLNLRKWRDVMEAYLGGGFAYHTTMPTDCLQIFRDAVLETRKYGFKKAHQDFVALGKATREMLERKGFRSVSAPGFQAPGVVVSYTDDAALVKKVKAQGVQLAAGVPWMLDEKEGAGHLPCRAVRPRQNQRCRVDGVDPRIGSGQRSAQGRE